MEAERAALEKTLEESRERAELSSLTLKLLCGAIAPDDVAAWDRLMRSLLPTARRRGPDQRASAETTEVSFHLRAGVDLTLDVTAVEKISVESTFDELKAIYEAAVARAEAAAASA
jgi:hypothetical protein